MIDNKEVRSYVSDFEGTINVIIDSNGVPLQSELSFEGSGIQPFVERIKNLFVSRD
ncbi:MAG: hypothetical protein HRU25_16570 [Psychrobium sp.]|nr:hypothetical protein [Psychrobium sp.]